MATSFLTAVLIPAVDRASRVQKSGYNRARRFTPMTSDIDLEMLMARYQQGELAAATSLIRSMSPRLHRFFLIQFSSREHADDLLQEMWLRIHKARHTYRPGEPVLPWLYAIARNIRVDHYRKAHRAESREQQLDEKSDIPEGPADRSAGKPDLEALLAMLPETQR